ncbi:hypothetical protein MRX96_030073 [Rhipicephalus microplus]
MKFPSSSPYRRRQALVRACECSRPKSLAQRIPMHPSTVLQHTDRKFSAPKQPEMRAHKFSDPGPEGERWYYVRHPVRRRVAFTRTLISYARRACPVPGSGRRTATMMSGARSLVVECVAGIAVVVMKRKKEKK